MSLNLYTYCYNDPVNFIDPSGHAPKTRTASDIAEEIDAAKRVWASEESKMDKSKGYDGWTSKQKEANAKANALREELAKLEKGNKTVQNLVNQKGDDAGTWAEYKRELKRKEIVSKGKVEPYDIYEFSKLDAIVDLERSKGRNIDIYNDAKLIEAQLTKYLGVNVEIDKNNNITFKDKNITWKYVGMDIYDATKELTQAGHDRSINASKKIKESRAFNPLNNAVENRKLNLNAKELEFLYHMDMHGTKDYLTTLPGHSKSEKEEKSKLRHEVYKRLTGEEPKYYEHVFLGGWQPTDKKKGNWVNAVLSDADIMLSRKDGMPDDLVDIAEPIAITAAALIATYEVGIFIAGVETYGFKNATIMYTHGTLKSSLRDYESINKRGVNTGQLTGSLTDLTQAERTVINDLLNSGKNVEVIPRSAAQGVKTPDFLIDGVKTELKTLTGTSLNTPVTRIQDAFKQGAQAVIIDGRGVGITVEQANTILNRATGVYKGNLPGNVQIWTIDGIVGR